jgi:hypothetical protein
MQMQLSLGLKKLCNGSLARWRGSLMRSLSERATRPACPANLASKDCKVAGFEWKGLPGGAVKALELTEPTFRGNLGAMELSLSVGAVFLKKYANELKSCDAIPVARGEHAQAAGEHSIVAGGHRLAAKRGLKCAVMAVTRKRRSCVACGLTDRCSGLPTREITAAQPVGVLVAA